MATIDGVAEKEVKGEDLKLATTEAGDPALDCDDDGRFPKRSGAKLVPMHPP